MADEGNRAHSERAAVFPDAGPHPRTHERRHPIGRASDRRHPNDFGALQRQKMRLLPGLRHPADLQRNPLSGGDMEQKGRGVSDKQSHWPIGGLINI